MILEVANLLGQLRDVVIHPDQEDRKIWEMGNDGIYTVSSGIHFFGSEPRLGSQVPWKDIWYHPVPLKIQFFMWVAHLGKISTVDILRKKGLILTNFCSFCKEVGESVSHVLLHYPFSWEIWFRILRNFEVC